MVNFFYPTHINVGILWWNEKIVVLPGERHTCLVTTYRITIKINSIELT